MRMTWAAVVPMCLAAVLLCSAPVLGAENLTPDQIKEGLHGKTKQEIKEMLGPPTVVGMSEGDETGQWNYTGNLGYGGKSVIILKGGRIIFDNVSEKPASNLEIVFKGGVVSRVRLVF